MANRYELDAIINALNKDNQDYRLIAGKAKMDAKRVSHILNGKEKSQLIEYGKAYYNIIIGTDGHGHWYRKEKFRAYEYDGRLDGTA